MAALEVTQGMEEEEEEEEGELMQEMEEEEEEWKELALIFHSDIALYGTGPVIGENDPSPALPPTPSPEYPQMAPPSSLTYGDYYGDVLGEEHGFSFSLTLSGPMRDLPTSPENEGVAAGSPDMEEMEEEE